MPEPVATSNEKSLRSDLRELVRKAHRRKAQVYRGERMGDQPLPGRDAAGRAAVPDGGPSTEDELHRPFRHCLKIAFTIINKRP